MRQKMGIKLKYVSFNRDDFHTYEYLFRVPQGKQALEDFRR